jgi:hypothetical protein
MVYKVVINLPSVERHLGVIQMFLQYDIMIELDDYINAKKSQRHLVLAEREWIFEQTQL